MKALSDDSAPGNLAELKASVDLGDTSAVTRNLTLPSVPGMTWSSSNPAAVTALGAVTRPAAGQGDAQATLTATFNYRGLTETKEFPVTVKQRVAFTNEQLSAGLVHHYKLDETSGTTLADSGSAGAAGNATLVNPDKATLTGAGVPLNPDAYADSLTGAYVDLPDNITAGMTDLTVDYDIRIDPANVGDHHLWSFGRKTNCDGTANGDYQGSIFGSNTMRIRTGLTATTPTTGSSVQRTMTYALREGVWKHLTYTQQRNANGTSWTGILYEDGVEIGRTTNLTVPPTVNAAGTNCNYLGRSQSPTFYALRGTLRNFRVYDRPLSEDEAIALAEPPGVAGVRDDAAAIDLGLTSAIVDNINLPKFGSKAGSTITWTTSNPAVVTANGVITRPALDQPAATATLTAKLTKGLETATRDIQITVPAQFHDAESVARDTDDLTLVALDDVRGNITLPAAGRLGVDDHLVGELADHHADRRGVPPCLRAPGRPAHADRHDHQGRVARRPRRSRRWSRRCRASRTPSATSSDTSRARASPTASNCASACRPATTRSIGSGSAVASPRWCHSSAIRACVTRSSSGRTTATRST